MTQNYKWYRLLSKVEFDRIPWRDVLGNHGYIPGTETFRDFAPDLMFSLESAHNSTFYQKYREWWNKHFGTKLSRYLYGVEDAL